MRTSRGVFGAGLGLGLGLGFEIPNPNPDPSSKFLRERASV